MTWQFDVDIRFYAQYGTRKSHIAKTTVHDLPWLWITILCSPIKGFGNDLHFHSWLFNLRESLPNHCCRWVSWEWNQWFNVLYSNIPNALAIEILLCCASVMEILLCCASVMEILLCCASVMGILLCCASVIEILLCCASVMEILLCCASVMEILLCCASVMEILLCCASVMEILLFCFKPKCERLT